MRLAVLADIHGNLSALEWVLEDLKRHSVDAVVNLGDCVTGPLWPRETYLALRALDFPTVRGNHDRWLRGGPWASAPASVTYARDELELEQIDWLAALPPTLELDGGVLAVHGSPGDDTAYLLEDEIGGRLALAQKAAVAQRLHGVDASLVLCAHSHVQHAVSSGERLVVNPGSVGCPRYADSAAPEESEPGALLAQYAVVTQRRARWAVDLCSVEYDLAPVIERARANRRDDWVHAFLGHQL